MDRRRFAQALAWLAALGPPLRPRTPAAARSAPAELPRLDRLGDPIPPRALVRVGTTRFRDRARTCGLESFALSPDGRLIATGSLHDPITLWDAATGLVVRRLGTPPAKSPGYSIRCHGLAFSADGSTLAAGRPGRTLERWELRQDTGIVRPGGRVERWEVATGRPLPTLDGHDDAVSAIAYSADGSTLVTADRGGTILIRDPGSGEVRRRLDHPGKDWVSAALVAVAVSADGSRLASGGDGFALTLWDAASGEPIRELAPPPRPGGGEGSPEWSRVAFAPDARAMAAARPEAVEVWEAAAGDHRRTIAAGSGSSFKALAFAPDGATLATASFDGPVRLWDVATGAESGRLGAIEGEAVGVAFGPDGRTLAAAGMRGGVHAWTLPGRAERIRAGAHQAAVRQLAFSSDGRTLVSVGDDAVLVTRADTGATLRRRERDRPGRWQASDLSPDGRWLAYQEEWRDCRFRILDLATGAVAGPVDLFRHQEYSLGFRFAADGAALVVVDGEGPDSAFCWIDPATGREVRRVRATGWPRASEAGDRFGSLTPSGDGRVLAVTASIDSAGLDAVVLFDAATGRFRRELARPREGETPRSFYSLALDPGGVALAMMGEDREIRIWDAGGDGSVRVVEASGVPLDAPRAVSPSGRILAAGTGDRREPGEVRLWDVASGRELARLAGHEAGVDSLAFSPDGRRLASGSRDTTVLVWDVAAWA